jgi:hypothetical protein
MKKILLYALALQVSITFSAALQDENIQNQPYRTTQYSIFNNTDEIFWFIHSSITHPVSIWPHLGINFNASQEDMALSPIVVWKSANSLSPYPPIVTVTAKGSDLISPFIRISKSKKDAFVLENLRTDPHWEKIRTTNRKKLTGY